ncbi:CPBP family intramembrane glutamic endopeptidase [Nonomuraea roseoviolacea]|uniref:Membrane protease YdiL (CAAX protease family) n=1 Tax=Nonomuraea roseoviolacea subsp. carminata TaxID=160689 RepID=A0ABT1JYI0_9ACTN|nr:CPBP family intramembrane glutamic endopeptidase [Nonomuraea roseoviolacea]MCP2346814.1 membrane protease YdiL (CAAX protease family) [Nonomuraea roseoviolacea subsp. carminata]
MTTSASRPTSTRPSIRPSAGLFTGVALTAFAAAYAGLILTGHAGVTASADPGASQLSLWGAALPPLAAMALARLVPPRREPPAPLAGLPRERLLKEAWALVAAAVLFACAAPIARGGYELLYPPVKVLLLLVLPLVAFRVFRGDGPKARAIPAPVTWLAPLPAVVAWFLLAQVSPLAPPLSQDLPDPVTLAVASLVTLLTASVLEEVFYRGWLQTRLEELYGRWPAVMASSLLFAFLHTSHISAAAPLLGVASIVAFQGVFGLMQGYLWARYRNIWAVILIHTLSNLVYVPMLLGR